RRRQHAPAEHDARDPDACAETLEEHVARNLERGVADEEDAGAEPEPRGRQAEVRVHGERREADVHAIEEGEEIEHAQQWDESPRCFAQDCIAGRARPLRPRTYDIRTRIARAARSCAACPADRDPDSTIRAPGAASRR